MNILLTMNLPYSRWSGGANRSNRHLLEQLAQAGHTVQAIVPLLATPSHQTEQNIFDELSAEGITVQRSASALVYKSRGVEVQAVLKSEGLRGHLSEQIKASRPDVVIVSSEDQSQQLLDIATQRCPSRVIYFAHTPQMFPFGPESLHPGKRRTDIVRRVGGIACISRTVSEYIQYYLGEEAFITHPPHYGPGPFTRCANYQSKSVLMLNPCAVKGITIFISLAKRFPEYKFFAVPGYGTTPTDLQMLSEVSNIEVRANVRSLDELLKDVGVLITPTLWMEGFGMAVIDAMLRGVPVLAAAYGGLVEAKLGTKGLLPISPIVKYSDQLDEALLPRATVPPQNLSPWCEALERLLTDEQYYEEQSQHSADSAASFVRGLSIAPLENWLSEIAKNNVERLSTQVRNGNADAAKPPINPRKSVESRIKALSPEKQSVLLYRLIQSATQLNLQSTHPIQRRPGSNLCPLSHQQEGVWLTQQLAPTSCAYNLSIILSMSGALCLSSLEEALQRVLRRHEILRTIYNVHQGAPHQSVQSDAGLRVETQDYSKSGERAFDLGLAYLNQLAAVPFRLNREIPIRVSAAVISPEQHLLSFVIHHICFDGWSASILARELSAAYREVIGHGHERHRPLTFQYNDYAFWQKQQMNDPEVIRQIQHWRNALQGIEPLRLSLGQAKYGAHSFSAGFLKFSVEGGVTSLMRRAIYTQGATMFTLILTGLYKLMYSWTGQTDIAIAIDVANRERPETHDLIGLFSNQLLVRLQIDPDMSARDLLSKCKEVLQTSLANQSAPWEMVSETLRRRPGGQGILPYQVKLVYGADPITFTLPGIKVKGISRPRSMTKCDLTVFVEDAGDMLAFEVEYNSDLLDKAVVERHFNMFPHILATLTSSAKA